MLQRALREQREVVIWCFAWFASNLLITFYNKYVLSHLDISPSLNTFSHMAMTFVGCLIVKKCEFVKLNQSEFIRLVLFTFIFVGNVVYSQLAMKLTTLSLNQVTRAATPMFQASLEYIIIGKKHEMYNLTPLIPVCVGVGITGYGELNLTMTAIIISISSVFVSALKGVLSMKILQNDLKNKLNEYSFLLYISPFSCVLLYVIQIVTPYFNYIYNNTQQIQNHNTNQNGGMFDSMNDIPWIYLIFGGFFAFLVNVASFGTVKRTSATAMGVMANAKQALTIFGSMVVFENQWPFWKIVGILTTLAGATWYTYRQEQTRLSKQKKTVEDITDYVSIEKDQTKTISPNRIQVTSSSR